MSDKDLYNNKTNPKVFYETDHRTVGINLETGPKPINHLEDQVSIDPFTGTVVGSKEYNEMTYGYTTNPKGEETHTQKR